jgi:hypothetical protein
LEGANIEFGLICIALNLSKMIKQMLEMGQKQFIFLKHGLLFSIVHGEEDFELSKKYCF